MVKIEEAHILIKDFVTASVIGAGVFTSPTLALKSSVDCMIESKITPDQALTLEKIDENKIEFIIPKQTLVEPVDDSLVVYHNDGTTKYMVQFFPSQEVKDFYEKYKEEGFNFSMCEEVGDYFGQYFLRPKWASRGGKAFFSNN